MIGFNHYNLRASLELMEQLREFYCRVVGLKVGARPPFDSFGYWLYAGENAILHLSQTKPGETRLPHIAGIFDHVAFSCTELAQTEAHLTACGVLFQRATVPHSGRAQLFFRDPAGNGVELNFAPELP
ncbi:VOC family protein [soil metagenome]